MNTFTRNSLLLWVTMLVGLVAAKAQPVANFTPSQTVGCDPSVITFTNISTGTVSGTTYQWNLGNGVNSTLFSPSTTYTASNPPAPTTYTITLTITNPNGQSSTVNKTVTIYANPTVNFSASDTAGCPPFTTSFTNSITWNAPGSGTYTWDFGNGATATTANPTYTYQSPGYYSPTLIATSSVGCSSFATYNNYIHVFTPPVANYSAVPPALCHLPGTVTFTNTSTGTMPFSSVWDFGDGSGTATGSPVAHAYTTAGSYTINLIVTDAKGCKDTLNVPGGMNATQLTADFAGPSSACVGALTQFNQASTPLAAHYYWSFGDGGTATGLAVNHVYTTAGTYDIRMIADNNGCSDTIIKHITINPKPAIAFTFSPANPCPAPVTIQFNNTTTGANSYTWSFGDGGSSTQASPIYTYNQDGFYNVKLVATTAAGCSDSLTKPAYVKIYPFLMQITADKTGGCIPVTIHFSPSSTTYPYPITSYFWDFGDGTSSSQMTATHTYSLYGTYHATLTVTTANGCTQVMTQDIHAGTPPTANFDAMPLTTCTNQLVQFNDSSSSDVTDWQWNFGDGGSSTTKNASHAYTLPGTYNVTLSVFNNGCKDSLTKLNYIHVSFPKSLGSFAYNCDTPLKVSFHNASLGYNSLIWYFGDGASSTDPNPVHYYAATGNYLAKLVTYNDTSGCHDTMSVNISVLQLIPSFTANDTAVCKGTTVHFTSTVTGGSPVQYDWIVDGIIFPDTSANFDYTFYATGRHTVSFKIKDSHDCFITKTKTDYILVSWPYVAFSANPPFGCAPATIVFNDQTPLIPGTFITSRIWDLGIGGPVSSPATTISQLYTSAGSYTIKLVLTDNVGCKDSLTKLDYVIVKKPVANFFATTTTSCVNMPIYFSNNSQGSPYSCQWDFGDGTTSTATSPAHAYTQTGTYTVKLVIRDSIAGCKDSLVRTDYITITTKPTAAFNLSDTFKICPPLAVTFTNNSVGAVSYNWHFGDGSSSVVASPTHVYNSGIFDVLLIANNAYGCKDTAKARVRVLGYAGELAYTPLLGCAPLTVNFTALEHNVPGFVFDFSDGSVFPTSGLTATHTYTHAGPYVPKLIMTDNAGCSSTSTGLDTIKVDGVYGGFTYDPYPACDHGTLQFLDTSHGAYSTINSRFWIFHDGTTSTSNTPSHTYNGTGTYPVTLIHTTTTGCIDTLETDITFYPRPVIDAGPDTTICLGDSATLQPSGGVSYTWTPSGSLNCDTCTHPFASPTAPTLYTLTGTDIHGCSNTDTVNVFIKTKTTATFSGNGEICEGDTMQLHVTGGHTYTWIPPYGLDNGGIADPIATPDTTTNYIVIVKEGSCIADTGYVNVLVHPRPHIVAGPDQTMVAGNTVQLTSSGNHVVRYEWSPAESLDCSNCSDPEASPKGTTTYMVRAYTDYGCHDSDDVTVKVICEQSQLFIPNTFTPNGNGENDRFYPRGRGIRTIKLFRVYDRWGELIFEKTNVDANDYNNGWDGTFRGKELSPDVYVYTMDGICDTGEEFSWQGDISLIR